MDRRTVGAAALSLALLLAPAARAGEDGATPDPARKPAPAKAGEAKPGEGKDAKPPAKDAKAAAKPAPAAPAVARRAPRSKAEALRMLDQVVVSVTFEGTTLADAVDYLGAVTGMNLMIGPALRKDGAADAIRFDLRLRKVTAKQVLDLMVSGRDLGIGFQNGVVTVTTLRESRGKPVLRLYPIGDMLLPIRDFPAPDLILRPAGAERTAEEPTETKHPYGDADEILAMVRDHTGSGTWEDEGVSASAMGDWIVVKQYEEVHAEIARLMRLLRSAR
jgi:hypothetical protein